MTDRVLIIEDEPDIAGPLAENLALEGYEVRHESDGAGGLDAARSWHPTLIVLDLMLPDIPGEGVLRQLREDGMQVPVLILSARQGEHEKVRGFRLGADDYVTKPFGLLEFLARVAALVRRAGQPARRATVIDAGDLQIDVSARRVTRAGEEVCLRPKEMTLLCALLERADQVVSRRVLLADVWGYDPSVGSRTVDWHIAELRRKLGDDPVRPALIETVRKVGYRFVLPKGAAQRPAGV